MKCETAICTLFEGNYHYGLGALVNSLYIHGFRGTVWAGYRGILPPWAVPITYGSKYLEYRVAEECSIRFLRIETNRHLTNYKPVFLLDLMKEHCQDAKALFYFDPDIVIKCKWSFFEDWANCGIALCEDVNSPMFATHPIRHAWLKFCKDYGVPVSREIDVYVSGGFIGISRGFATFLNIWNSLVEALEGETGSLKELGFSHRPYPFYNGDQDALNITIMATDIPLSLIGKEGMDFSVGGYVMSHAAGSAKPWRKRMLVSALRGISPSLQDKAFWRHVRHPIRLYSASTLLLHRCDMIVGSAIGLVLKRA